MNLVYTVSLLIVSNVFMTFAWYGHLKLQQINVFSNNTPLYLIIICSWLLALPEYACQVPANRIGFVGNGGTLNLMQLKVIQEVISLTVFTVFVTLFFNGESLHWNHAAAFLCLILAVFFVFME
ncbi:MAG: DMT family protein [Prevotella sp.]|nr:DMT family protein [Prevotella sp.]